jgi:short-subunit dehydrogenase
MFNNAGIVIAGRTHEMQPAQWERVIDVNIRGVVNGVLAAYPVMVAQRSGHIVNTASGVGLVPSPLVVAYAATKHAVVGLSGALRPEAAALGVRVSVICPGSVDTPILDTTPFADPSEPGAPALTGRDYLKTLRLRPMPAERFAEIALRQVIRNRAVIVVPTSAKALWYLHRLSPGLVEHAAGVMMRRVLRRVDEALRAPMPGSPKQ